MKTVKIYTDGSCLGNPGPGGWACILFYEKDFQVFQKELSGGFSRTTNNRMELWAVLEGLKALKIPCEVDLYTDSQYVAKAVSEHWLDKWLFKNWMRDKKHPVKNKDLWSQLPALLARHNVHFHWLKGHAGHLQNERCDELARSESAKSNLPLDNGYEEELKNNLVELK